MMSDKLTDSQLAGSVMVPDKRPGFAGMEDDYHHQVHVAVQMI